MKIQSLAAGTAAALVLAGLSSVTSCGGASAAEAQRVLIDGSSTVFPITEAVGEEYLAVAPSVQVTVGVSGTGGGFKKFIAGETHISDASRYIKQKEIDGAAAAGLEYIELPVAFDGLAVVVNKANDWATSMTTAELQRMWAADSTAHTWADIREGWPARPFKLYAPGQDSGTFDYFTEEINGKSGNCRADATFSEDDNVLVKGVAGDLDGIGFFGLAYFEENASVLNVVAVDGGAGPVAPTFETVADGSYAPLSRPLFLYVSKKSADELDYVRDFVEFYLDNARQLSTDVGYIALPEDTMASIKQRFASRRTGTEQNRPGDFFERYR